MRTIATNEKNDMYLNMSRSIEMSSGEDAVSSVCEKVVQTMLGELVLQGDTGMPNFQTIWNGTPNIPQAENAIRVALLGVDNVLSVSSLSVFVEENILKYNANITTTFGEVQLGV